jgi:hypothetical protein
MPLKSRIYSSMSAVAFSTLQTSWQEAYTDLKKNAAVLKQKYLKLFQE